LDGGWQWNNSLSQMVSTMLHWQKEMSSKKRAGDGK
jgi:hypothetical protein